MTSQANTPKRQRRTAKFFSLIIFRRLHRKNTFLGHIGESIILPYSQSYPHDLPRMTSLSSSTGVGWQATRPISRVDWQWRHRKTRRNGNVARLDSSNFPTFTSKKYLFWTYRRKIINIYCPLVTEKSTTLVSN